MSDRQREIKARIEAILAARNRGDWDALFAELDPDAEWEPIAETVIYRGREAITEYFARWDDAWAEFWIDAERIDVSRDDVALLAARYCGRGKGSGSTFRKTRTGPCWQPATAAGARAAPSMSTATSTPSGS